MPVDEEKLKFVKKNLRATLQAEKGGCLAYKFENFFRNTTLGDTIPWRQFGFPDLESFIRTVPDTVSISINKDGQKVYLPVADESSAHIQRMVAAQRSKKPKGKGSRARPSNFNFRKSISSSSSRSWAKPLHRPFTSSRPTGGRRPPPLLTQWPPRGKPRNTSSFHDSRFSPRSESPEDEWDLEYSNKKTSNTTLLPTPRPTPNLPPRLQRKQQQQIQSTINDSRSDSWGSSSGGFGSKPARKPIDFSKSVTKAPPSSKPFGKTSPPRTSEKAPSSEKDYRSLIESYRVSHKLDRLVYATVTNNRGFASSLNINGRIFGSIDVFKTRNEAEKAAAKNACEGLGILGNTKKSPEKDSKYDHGVEVDYYMLKKRVQETLLNTPNGLWQNRLAIVYNERYNEKPPSVLLELLEEWDDICKIESVRGSDKKILYPVNQSRVRISQSEPTTTVDIPKPVIPKLKSRIKIGITFVYTPSHFYVQLEANAELVEKLQELLNETYESRGSPKAIPTPESGTFCVSKYTDDNWYRARIKKVLKQGADYQLDVFYIDYGNQESVSNNRVRRIIESMCKEPAQAIKCSLDQTFPKGSQWSVEELQAISNYLDTPIEMEVCSVQDETCQIKLFECGSTSSINEQLIERGVLGGSKAVDPEPLVIPTKRDFPVFVSYVKTTVDVVVRIMGADHSEKLDEIEEALSKLPIKPIVNAKQGDLCVYSDDDKSYRVRILSIEDDQAEVCFLDHGDSDLVSLNHLIALPARLNHLPYQALSCKLTGLEPYENDDRVYEQLEDAVLSETFVAEVNDRHGCTVSITLWDTSTEKDVNINQKIAQVLSVEDLKPTLPEVLSETVEGYISHVTEEGQFFFNQEGPGLQKLEELTDKLQSTFQETKISASSFLPSPEVGKSCVARFHDKEAGVDGWYRADITEILPGRKAKVFYVDFGNSDVVTFRDLRSFPEDLASLKSLPYQAVKMWLNGIPPAGKEMTKSAHDVIVEMLPPDKKIIVELVKIPAEGEIPLVEIYDIDDNDVMMGLTEVLFAEGVFDTMDQSIIDELADFVETVESEQVVPVESQSSDNIVDEDVHICSKSEPPLAKTDALNTKNESDVMMGISEVLLAEGIFEFVDDSMMDDLADDIASVDSQNSDVFANKDAEIGAKSEASSGATKIEADVFCDDDDKFAKGDAEICVSGDSAKIASDFSGNPINASQLTPPKQNVAFTKDRSPIAEDIPLPDDDDSFSNNSDVVDFDQQIAAANFVIEQEIARVAESAGAVSQADDSDSAISVNQSVGAISGHVTSSNIAIIPPFRPGVQFSDTPSNTSVKFSDAIPNKQEISPEDGDKISSDMYSNQTIIPETSAHFVTTECTPELKSQSLEDSINAISIEASKLNINCEEFVPSPKMFPSPKMNVNCEEFVPRGILKKTSKYEPLAIPETVSLPTSGDQVYVTWVSDPNNFRCIPQASINELNKMMQEMFEHYSTEQSKTNLEEMVYSPSEGELYAGEKDELWYRVMIKKVIGNQVAIHFIDYGDFSIIPATSLRQLPVQFRQLPFQAISAKLAEGAFELEGVATPEEEGWSDEAVERFRELVLEQTLTAWIHDKDDTGFVSMTLVNTASTENAFIHKVLIQEGLVRKYEGS